MLDWFWTNSEGIEYMTLMHCALRDNWVVWTTVALCAAVLYFYFEIARESWKQGRRFENSITKKYLTDKAKVFLFCGLTGYGYTIMSVFINPYKLRIILLVILLYMTIQLYRSLKVRNTIERIYEGEQLIQRKLMHYKLTKDRYVNNDDGAHNIITFDESAKSQYNVWVDAGNGVRYMRVYNEDYELFYICEMDPSKTESGIAGFSLHWHDCVEHCKIKKGHLIEMTDDFKEYKVGETISYLPYDKHKPVANKFSVYEVGFIKA